MGNNGITEPAGHSFAKATDASITLEPYCRTQASVAGLFKYPGAEEGLQAIHVFDYINFTEVTNQLLLERLPNAVHTANLPPYNPDTAGSTVNGFDKPVGAFRDTGLQLFDSFRFRDFELSYAAMYGNGNGLNFSDNDNNKDSYLYLAGEWVLGGKGVRREGLKGFVWSQKGKRSYDGDNDGTIIPTIVIALALGLS